MGFLNSDYRCFDGDSIDFAAQFEETMTSFNGSDNWSTADSWTSVSSKSCTLELLVAVSLHGILVVHFGAGLAIAVGALSAYGVISIRHISHLRRIIADLDQTAQ